MIRQTSAHNLSGRLWAGHRGRLVAAVASIVTASATAVVVAIPAAMIVAVIVPVTAMVVAVAITTMVAVAVPFAVARGVFLLVPVVLDEVDAFAAGAVAMAMPAPVAGMAGRYAQVERRAADRRAMDHHRFGKEQGRRWETPNVEAAVKAWLADIDRNLGGSGGAESGSGYGEGYQDVFHGINVLVGVCLNNAFDHGEDDAAACNKL
jgi:hypothetical protein